MVNLSITPEIYPHHYLPIWTTGPKTFTLSSSEQFHRMCWNWCLHSTSACCAPTATTCMWSWYRWHRRLCPALRPGRNSQLGVRSECISSFSIPIRLKEKEKLMNTIHLNILPVCFTNKHLLFDFELIRCGKQSGF